MTRWRRARPKLAVAFEFIEKLGAPFYCFHDRDVAPEGDDLAETRANLDAVVDDAEGEQERTGIKLLWGTANLFSNPRYMHGAATSPDPDVFAYAAAQVKKMLEVTQRLGGENYVLWGGREGYDTLLNTDMKRELDHLARFLHLAVEYKKKIGFEGHVPHRAQAEGADQAPVRLRRRRRSSASCAATGSRSEYKAQHRDQPRDARRPQLPPRARATPSPTGCSAPSTPTAATRCRLGHRPVPELGRGPGRCRCYEILRGRRVRAPAASTSTPRCAARASSRTTCSTPTSAAWTRSPAACWWRRTSSSAASSRGLRGRRYAGWDGDLGTTILGGSLSLADLEARVADGEIDPVPGVGRAGAAREPRQPAHLGRRPGGPGLTDGRRPRHRRLDHGDEGRPDRRDRERPSAIGTSEYGFEQPAAAVERAGPAPVVGREPGRRSAGARRGGRAGAEVEGVGLTGQMHGLVLLDAAGEVLRPAILWNDQRTAPSATRSARPSAPERLDRDHRQRRADRVHRAEAGLGPRPRARRLARGSPTCCCPRTTCASG